MSSVELEGKRKSEDIPIFPYISIYFHYSHILPVVID